MKKSVILLLFLVLIACAKPEAPAPQPVVTEMEIVKETPIPEKPQYEPPPTAPTEAENVVEIKMEAKMFEFLPSEIKVNKGDKVKLTITATDVPHTFALVAYGIDEELPVGQDVIVEFTADKEGTFTFTCGVPGHEGSGMKGKLIVT